MRQSLHSFPPIDAADAEILILGSIPSVRSLCENQYYGHPQNAFWWIMGAIFDFDPALDYNERKSILIDRKVALWDVARSCERKGSLDSAIKSSTVIANDFETFFKEHPRISRVFFNGAKAESEFNRLVLKKKRTTGDGEIFNDECSTLNIQGNSKNSKLNVQSRIKVPNTPTPSPVSESTLFKKLRFSRLPSTSPAMASMTKAAKLAAWSAAITAK